jgi:hypothetical protein
MRQFARNYRRRLSNHFIDCRRGSTIEIEKLTGESGPRQIRLLSAGRELSRFRLQKRDTTYQNPTSDSA